MFQPVQNLSGINVNFEMHYVRRAAFGLMILMCNSLSTAAQTSFSEQKIIAQSDAFSPTSVFAADLDGDGDQDVLSASSGDNKIAWYENEGSAMDTDIETVSDVLPLEIELRIFPNPASENLFTQLVGAHPEPYRIGVFDLLGRRVFQTEETSVGGAPKTYRLDVSRLAPGMYVVRIEGSSSVYHRLVAVIK